MTVLSMFDAILEDPGAFPDWWSEEDGACDHPSTTSVADRLIEAVIPSHRLTLTVEETAKVVDIGRTAAYEAVRRGDLPSKRINGRIVVPVPALLAWLGVECRTP